jgi:hypothetical protein
MHRLYQEIFYKSAPAATVSISVFLMPCMPNNLSCPGRGGQQDNEIAVVHPWKYLLAGANVGSACGTRMAIKETLAAEGLSIRWLEFLPIDNPRSFISARHNILVEKGARQNVCCNPK